jgi:hypothetical protein
MPVARGEHGQTARSEQADQAVDRRDRRVAVRDAEGTARKGVVLQIHDEQRVAGAEASKGYVGHLGSPARGAAGATRQACATPRPCPLTWRKSAARACLHSTHRAGQPSDYIATGEPHVPRR